MSRYIATLILIVLFIQSSLSQQVNCDAYKQDSLYYKACLKYTKACKYFQGAKESQIMLDEVVEICPYFGDAYYVKAIPYLKRGDFITWKKLIDMAVEYAPEDYLGYRGGCRFMFLRDYKGAINDIEHLITFSNNDIGYIYNGDYHLKIILALSYKGIGNKKKAIAIIENQLSTNEYEAGLYDYLHLGVLKLEVNNYDEAILLLNKQIKINDYVAETYYYLALAFKKKGNEQFYIENLKKSKEYFLQGKELPGSNSFMDYMDKVYLVLINEELESSFVK